MRPAVSKDSVVRTFKPRSSMCASVVTSNGSCALAREQTKSPSKKLTLIAIRRQPFTESATLLFDGDPRGGRRGHATADLEAGVRGLVVGGLLGRDLHPVLRIVHQRIDAASGGVGGRVDAKSAAVRRAPDDLFAPIAEQIGGQRGCRLRAVVRADA